ncbi:MAG: hypothetical protein LBT32_05910 [Peptococcaceae bacterium]|jgi:hypothetical protein|nr:hypothetical protein [Peptococcaceae bacterium]
MRQLIKLSLCQKGCCPIVEFGADQIVIHDDNDGQVSLTYEQFQLLVAHFANLEGENSDL